MQVTWFRFHHGPQVVSGASTSAHLSAFVPADRILFITDPGVRGLGLCNAALAGLAEAGKNVTVFDAVEADPSAATVLKAVAQGMGSGVEAVVGFGGGSPMDVAKLAAYLIGTGEMLDSIYGVGLAQGRGLPLVLVPTTAGTGSEATGVAVVTVGGAEKRGVNAPALLADWAVLDPDLTLGLPPAITAATGIDAMVHAVEAYTCARGKNTLSDLFAREALRLLAGSIRKAVADGTDRAARSAMLHGAYLAGVAFANAPVGGIHALAYPLGGHFHVPHGLSNALMMGPVMRFNMPAASGLYAELAAVIDPTLTRLGPQAAASGLVQTFAAIAADCGIAGGLRAVGVEAAHLDLLANEAMKQLRLLVNNPRRITWADARALYEAAL